MRTFELAPLPLAAVGLAVLATCCPAEPAKPTLVKPAEAPAAAPMPPPPPPPPAGPPVARTVDVVDHQFGIAVPDPYRWMEGIANTEYTTWLAAQGAWAKRELAKLPKRDELFSRIRELGLGLTAVYGVQIEGGRTIYSELPAGAQLAKLMTRDGTTPRTLLDPEQLGSNKSGEGPTRSTAEGGAKVSDKSGEGPTRSTAEGGAKVNVKHASLNAYSLSPDGKYVGYVIAMGGGEVGQIHVMDVATGKELADVEEPVWGEFAPSWLPDSKSFFFTQMVKPAEGGDPWLNMLGRYHKLGDPVAKDVTVLGREPDATFKLLPHELPGLWIDPSSPWVIAQVGGARSEQRIAIAKVSELDLSGKGKTPWKIIAQYEDAVEGAFPHDGRLWISTYKDAPNRKLISVPLAAPVLANARVELAEDPQANLAEWSAARDGIYFVRDRSGLAELSRMPWGATSTPPARLALPGDGWVGGLITDMKRDGVTFSFNTWQKPGAYFAYDPKTKQVAPTGLASSSKFIDDRIVATEVEAPSKDGVQVPLSILHYKDIALDGSHPTLIAGYAAYGSSQHAYFSTGRIAWLERGGVYAICHARGGGERGRKWQDDGSREHKLNGIADVIACGEYLVAHHYTTAQHQAIEGGSMGGILMGRALDERPDLFAAVHIAVGAVNPLRILAAENGANQIGELGDPGTEAGYKSILAFDPYLNVKPSTAYPAVIFTIGLNDHRVAPWMTGKMAARLRATTSSTHPILVRVEDDAGHGIGSTRDQGFAETADVWAFLLQQFGL
ncbi:MAG TPA: prolyl oligopeptidase family serine peptidase [Kofleriaceae bacterium]|nr:prolyl oligopeptidase family serine peptidase [Kofleriaceae bacterium]